MAAASRFRDLVAMFSRGFARLGDLRFHQSNFSIATEWTDSPLYSFEACEARVKERHPIYTMLSDAEVA